MRITMPSYVLNLWRVECRILTLSASDRSPFSLNIATSAINERDVVRKIKQRFTPEWWEGVLIVDVVQAGKLHMVEDTPLYEEA